jgi:hypothetical protein
MTQTERNRFTILTIILIVLVIAGIGVAQFRKRSEVGADVALGQILNQAVATYSDPDGIPMELSLSSISQLTVTGGEGKLTLNYALAKRVNQNIPIDIQVWQQSQKSPFAVFNDESGEEGTVSTTLKNVANGQYDISAKPFGYLSQSARATQFTNGKAENVVEYKDGFLWGDIDVSNQGRGDNKINNADWSVLLKAWDTDDAKADFNADGIVNNADASVLLGNWDKSGVQFKNDRTTEDASADDAS